MVRMIFALVFVLAIYCVQPTAAAELHVAPGGAANAPGTKDRPIANLEQARDAVRAWKKNGELGPDAVTVWVHGGDYFCQRSFTLSEEDSGTAESPVVYRNWPGETPRLLGGKPIDASSWNAVVDPKVLARLSQAARDNVFRADLKPLGVTSLAAIGDRFRSLAGTPELFFNGEVQDTRSWRRSWTRNRSYRRAISSAVTSPIAANAGSVPTQWTSTWTESSSATTWITSTILDLWTWPRRTSAFARTPLS